MHLTGIFRACCQQSKQKYNVTQQTPKLHLEINIENQHCLHKTEYLQWNTCLRLAVAVQGIIKEEIIKAIRGVTSAYMMVQETLLVLQNL